MDIIRLRELIEQGRETDFLDFKEQFHENNAYLLHDILCLANNTRFQDAYIVFGINDRGETVGVENDQKRIKSANIHDFLNNIRHLFFNNEIPEVDVVKQPDSGHEIDILEIKSTLKVPYFLIEEYKKCGVTVRSGHIYTRTGDRNTPIDQCAPPDQTIKLWEKRFGRLENNLNKLLIYLDDLPNWKKESIWNEYRDRYYYEPDSTFVIEKILDNEDEYSPPRYKGQPYGISTMSRGYCKCIANQIVIYSGTIYYIDGAKSIISETKYHPFRFIHQNNLVLAMDFYLMNSVEYKLLPLFNQVRDGFSDFGLNLFLDQTLVFSSLAEVDSFKGVVEKNIDSIIRKVEESSGIKFEDEPYDRRKHDEFRIHTGRILKEIQHKTQLKGVVKS